MPPNQEGRREEPRVRPECLRHRAPCDCIAVTPPRFVTALTPSQEEIRIQEQETRLQTMSDRSRWEGGHRVDIKAQVDFPGDPELRQQFTRQEDRAIVNRTTNFLRQTRETGASVDRFCTLLPLDRIPSHQHNGGQCQIVAISCSSEALNKLKQEPLMDADDEPEILPQPNTGSTTSNNINVEAKVRVE